MNGVDGPGRLADLLGKGVIVGAAAVEARLENGNAGLGIGPDDRILWLLPMAHHFLVLWPIEGSPEFHLWYGDGAPR